jgi:hypothetical protein
MHVVEASKETVESVCNWIAYNLKKTKTIRKLHSSYALKHVAERSIGGVYISSLDFAECMKLEGFDSVTDEYGKNAYFNVSEKSIKVAVVRKRKN